MHKLHKSQAGFTIIELMIATTIYSVVMLLATFSIVQIGRTFYKGVISSRTQEMARNISAEISRGIQFSTGNFPAAADNSGASFGSSYCIGGKGYYFNLHQKLEDSTRVLVRGNDCTSSAGGTELMGGNMRLSKFSVTPGPGDTVNITVKVVYGDTDLLDNPSTEAAKCKGIRVGGEFCAVSELTTSVTSRL